MVEAAFVMPIFMVLIFAIVEFSLVTASYTAVGNAVREGTRMASVQGNSVNADQLILERIASGAAGLSDAEINYIVIWHATGPDDKPPVGCIPASYTTPNATSVGVSDGGPLANQLGACNVYIRPTSPGGAFDMASGKASNPADYYFGCKGNSDPDRSHTVDCNWPATHRQIREGLPGGTQPNLETDYVGIYIRATHQYATQLFGSSKSISDKSVAKIEPQDYAK